MTNTTKKTKKPIQWRALRARENDQSANSPAKPIKKANGEKKPRVQPNRPKRYATKKLKTVVRANPGYLVHPECDTVFANKVHAFQFRIAMLSARARDHIAVGDQLKVAHKVEAQIDALEMKLGRSIPSDIVAQLVDAMVIDMERAA